MAAPPCLPPSTLRPWTRDLGGSCGLFLTAAGRASCRDWQWTGRGQAASEGPAVPCAGAQAVTCQTFTETGSVRDTGTPSRYNPTYSAPSATCTLMGRGASSMSLVTSIPLFSRDHLLHCLWTGWSVPSGKNVPEGLQGALVLTRGFWENPLISSPQHPSLQPRVPLPEGLTGDALWAPGAPERCFAVSLFLSPSQPHPTVPHSEAPTWHT